MHALVQVNELVEDLSVAHAGGCARPQDPDRIRTGADAPAHHGRPHPATADGAHPGSQCHRGAQRFGLDRPGASRSAAAACSDGRIELERRATTARGRAGHGRSPVHAVRDRPRRMAPGLGSPSANRSRRHTVRASRIAPTSRAAPVFTYVSSPQRKRHEGNRAHGLYRRRRQRRAFVDPRADEICGPARCHLRLCPGVPGVVSPEPGRLCWCSTFACPA